MMTCDKFDLMFMLNRDVHEDIPERITLEELAILQAGGRTSPRLANMQTAVACAARCGRLIVMTEKTMVKVRDRVKVRIPVQGFRLPYSYTVQGPEKDVEQTVHWVTRAAASAWLKSLPAEPTPYLRLWIKSDARITPDERAERMLSQFEAYCTAHGHPLPRSSYDHCKGIKAFSATISLKHPTVKKQLVRALSRREERAKEST